MEGAKLHLFVFVSWGFLVACFGFVVVGLGFVVLRVLGGGLRWFFGHFCLGVYCLFGLGFVLVWVVFCVCMCDLFVFRVVFSVWLGFGGRVYLSCWFGF